MKINRSNYEIWFLDYAEGKLTKEQKDEVLQFIKMNPDLKDELESFEIISLEQDDAPVFSGKSFLHKKESVINTSNYEDYFIAYAEGILSPDEKAEVEGFASSSPALLKELNGFLTAILTAENISHDEKAFLKKEVFAYRANDKDYWLIAFIEGKLQPEQERSFREILANDKSLQRELKQYQLSMLVADRSIIYGDKENLKQGENKNGGMQWQRYLAYAAAACLLLFFFIPNDKQETPGIAETIIPGIDTASEIKNELVLPEVSNDNNIASVEENVITPENKLQPEKNSQPEIALTNRVIFEPVEYARQINPRAYMQKSLMLPDTTNHPVGNVILPGDDLAASSTSEEFISPLEFVTEKVNNKLFGSKQEEVEQAEIASSVKSTMIGNVPLTIKNEKNEEFAAFGFSIGNFSFSRTVDK
jgi:hypothetical protein